jgi:hypothetical protein
MANDMISVLMLTKEPNEHNWAVRGRRDLFIMPRLGEVIKLEKEEEPYLYKVVFIRHVAFMLPRELINQIDLPTTEIYAVFIGSEDNVLSEIFEAYDIPRSKENSADWIDKI